MSVHRSARRSSHPVKFVGTHFFLLIFLSLHEVDLVFIRFGHASKGWKFGVNARHIFIGVLENLVALILKTWNMDIFEF